MNIKSESDAPSDITYSDSSNSYSNCKNEDKFPNLEAIKNNNNTSINNIYNSQLPQSSGDTLGIKSFPDISQYLPDIQQNNPKTEIKIKKILEKITKYIVVFCYIYLQTIKQ